MTAIAQQLLPLGFRFHPTDEELINHYLKRKITGRIKYEAEVIPEVDVCKCEPWDLPDKSIIRSDDPEWFFFAPKDRKYANGHRSNRATVAGYWKATGKDRVIRSKAAAAGHNMIGMKKTLVFHRGRAPKGTRTHWIMHEYRTTEPEFESGVQGGYVLYRLFKKNEERSSNSRADEMERGCFSPAQARLSPGDTQHEEDVMEEITGPLNQESSESVLQEEPHSLPDVVEQQPAVMHADPLQDSSPQYHHPQYEKIDSNGFPNTSSPVLPNTDHRIDPGYDSDDDQDINEFLDAILSTQDECSSGASHVQKDSIAETVSRSSIWDSASFRDSGTSSEIDAEATLPQELLGLEASKGLEGSPFLSNDALQMNSLFGYPEIEPQLSALYEHATLLPYDSTGPDVCSEDITADSLQDLFKSMMDDGGDLEATGIKFRARQPQHPSNLNNMFELQGTAARRFRLQDGTLNSSMWSADSESSSNRDDHEDKEALKKALQDLYDSTEGSLTQKNTPSTEDGFEATGIKIRVRQAQHPPSLPQKQGMAARRICLQTHLEVGTFPSTVSESSKREDDHDDEVSATEAEEHVDDNIAEFVGLSKPSSPDRHKLEQLSGHDNTAPDSELYLESKPMLRLRTKWAGDNANISDEPPPSRRRTPRTASVVYVIGLVLSVILVLMCVGIWRSMNSQRM